MKKHGRSAGSLNKSYCIPLDLLEIFEDFEKIAQDNGVSVSEAIVGMMKEKVHGVKKLTAQMSMDNFEMGIESQVPSLANDSDEVWRVFYQQIKSKEDYKKLDTNLMLILKHHNKKVKEF